MVPRGPWIPQSGALPSQQEASRVTRQERREPRGGALTFKRLGLEVTHVIYFTYTPVPGTSHMALPGGRGTEECHLAGRLGRREEPDMQAH